MKSIKSLTPRSLAQQGVSKGEASPLLRLRHRWHQQRRVDALVAPVHAPVEMRAGDAPGLAEAGHHLVLAHPLADRKLDAVQVQEGRAEAVEIGRESCRERVCE